MSKIFICYRRKSWAFTHRLAEELRGRLNAEIFVDIDSIDVSDFETAIFNNLRQSDLVLLVVSEITFTERINRDDDWVRREIRDALVHNIPLLMVCVDGLLPPAGLPDDIKDITRMQGVNFYPEYFTSAVEKLTDFITRVSHVERKGALHGTGTAQGTSIATGTALVGNTSEQEISGKVTLDEALDSLDQGDYSKAVFLLEKLQQNVYKSSFVNIDELLKEAKVVQKQAELRRTAQIEYDEISRSIKRGINIFQAWQQKYPDLIAEYNIENLRNLFAHNPLSESNKKAKTASSVGHISSDIRPRIESLVQTARAATSDDQKPNPIRPMKLFYSYARIDHKLKLKLDTHLGSLKNQHFIESWSDQDITAGKDWENEINENLRKAEMILLLISADFNNSDYIRSVEMSFALEQDKNQKARVIPILLRPCDWEDSPYASLQFLPIHLGNGNLEHVTSAKWKTQDEAFTAIAKGIKIAIKAWRKNHI